jgi:probable rRNA maturation factor
MASPSESSGDSQGGPALLSRQRRVKVRLGPLRDFLARLRQEVAGGKTFSLCLVSDAVMRRYNRQYRGQDYPTDVLSFPDDAPERAGDLLVSVETARRQARRLGHPLETEIEVLALHGLLHLLGHDHEGRRGGGRMARAERRWRRRFALPLGLIKRAGSRGAPARRAPERGVAA